MDLETQSFGSELFAYNDGQDGADVDRDAASDEQKKNRVDSVEAETSLIRAVYLDSRSELAAQTKRLGGTLDRATAAKLLHLCCNFDSAECAAALLGGEVGEVPLINELNESGKSPLHTAAESHAWRCVEILLKKHARTDLRTMDGQAQLALQLSLSDTRMDQNWDPIDLCTGKDSIINMSEKGLKTLKLLSEETEVAEVAYSNATKGRVASLIALLIVAPDKVINSVFDFCDSESGWQKKGSIYECLIWEVLALGRRTKPPLTAEEESKNLGRRKLLLQEIELLQLLGAVTYSGGGVKRKKKVTSPLIRAAQVGDEEVMQLLLNANKFDVNSTDADYNSALHWILMSSRLSCPLQIRILLLLLRHGAVVSQRNKLGLTAFHIAACNGNSEALKVLLLEDPDGVHYKTKMDKTPLFFAVKKQNEDCTTLLLTWGSNNDLNKRKRRAIDLATSQEMRYILLNSTAVNLMNDDLPDQIKCMAQELADEETTTTRNVNTKAEAAACSIEPQAHITKSSKDPSTPTWLKVFRKWFPGFLQGLSKDSNYALSSLKDDFMATFGLKLDHSSVGYSKLSDFLKGLSNLCTIESGSLTHMILRPKLSSPPCRLLPTPRTPHTLSLSLSIVNCGDSKDLQNSSNYSSNDAKCLQDHPGDNVVDSKYLPDLSLYAGGDLKITEDGMCGSSVSSHGKEKVMSFTTIIAYVSEEGMLITADGKVSLENEEIISGCAEKIFTITYRILVSISGEKRPCKRMINRVRAAVRKLPGKVGMAVVVKLFQEKMKIWREKHGLKEKFPGRILVFGYRRGEAAIYDVKVGEYLKVEKQGVYGCGSGYKFGKEYLDKLLAQKKDFTDDEMVDRLLAAQAISSTYDISSGSYVSVLGLWKSKKKMKRLEGDLLLREREHVVSIIARTYDLIKEHMKKVIVHVVHGVPYIALEESKFRQMYLRQVDGVQCFHLIGKGKCNRTGRTVIIRFLVFIGPGSRTSHIRYPGDEVTDWNTETILVQHFLPTQERMANLCEYLTSVDDDY